MDKVAIKTLNGHPLADTEAREKIEELEKSSGGGGGSDYVLPPATADTLGGVKVGEGLRMDGDVLGVDKKNGRSTNSIRRRSKYHSNRYAR